jgi:hypothetical protein
MKLYGLMITKDDAAIFAEWCHDQLPLYDAVVCLDGTAGDEIARMSGEFKSRLIYLRECDFSIPHKSDHGLRSVVHEEITRRFGFENWIMCCHADEFCYHDPRKIVAKAASEGFDLVSWFSLHFCPHPSELADWDVRRALPIRKRHRHYHWSYRGDGFPWCEDRLYRNGLKIHWDRQTHGSVRPLGVERPAPFHPIFCHYKVFTTDLGWYEPRGTNTYFRSHWTELKDRTGLPFPVRQWRDLFVSSLPPYEKCDRFDGVIREPWNMGEQYCPSRSCIA